MCIYIYIYIFDIKLILFDKFFILAISMTNKQLLNHIKIYVMNNNATFFHKLLADLE